MPTLDDIRGILAQLYQGGQGPAPAPGTPTGQRPLVGGGAENAIAMLLQSSPVAKAQNYATQLIDAAKLPGDLATGRQQSNFGLRREDYTDDPTAPDPNEHMTQGAVSLADVMSMGGLPMAAVSGTERGALGIGAVPKFPQNWRSFTESGRREQSYDKTMAAIQDALKAGSPTNSGVPLIKPTVGPQPNTEDVLRAISEALKLAPK